MTPKHEVMAALDASGVVAIIRTENPQALVEVAKSLSRGGVKFIEITMTVPGALQIIREARAELGGTDVYIGAGTVLDAPTAKAAIEAGAQFIVGPGIDVEMIRVCNTYAVPVMPGAFTPTEVIQAWRSGADVVKLFPADIGGPEYLKGLRDPLPQVQLMPTKGINFDTAAAYIKAGAIAVGSGSFLVNKALIAAKDYARLTANAERLTQIVREAKEGR
jgi:2-dehydro-3-deoxyphosphogluconate aldolase / (4S)-4-hydroxy-2-oxoglutarate aldolase